MHDVACVCLNQSYTEKQISPGVEAWEERSEFVKRQFLDERLLA